MLPKLNSYTIILASKSPRRQQLLKELGVDFIIKTKDIEEVYPSNLKKEVVALFLSEQKANAFKKDIKENEIVITSDTIVCLGNEIIGKPTNRTNAIEMLEKLSGKRHEVITAVTLFSIQKKVSFSVCTEVFFKPLSMEEITYYIDNYKPYDKAGSYGIQEWIGYIGIEKIVGSYFNVMGLPVKEVYEELIKF
ncbi:MAG: Maf family nucleotide pyrophosphatase [Vicingaceae bacterium]|nr:Maf family nucleotide pyrophosphatase [Vicingaceae bacterium]